MAYEFAKRQDCLIDSTMMALWDWLKGIRERSLRIPEATSAARTRAFNQPQVMKFFELLDIIKAK